ncbi:MAG: cation diffusion facilitator family transporter [Ignavibacteriales bacterium CG_4_9_14_3_um_filter_30_11]|nr:MAG: cation diffusion facilitator family transporter [Ignavibacteriales bacterium CG_4_9_14_3_um_filter_30_11]
MGNNSFTKLRRKAILISLVFAFFMLAAKLGAYFLTNSAAIFSDAAESVVHILATSMAFFSIILSSKPADESHLYGHGNIEYFSAGVEGLFIIIASIYIIYSAINDLIVGTVLKQLDIGIYIITIAGLLNLGLGYYLIKIGKKTNSLTLVADGKHVLTDSFTSIGVIIGIILVLITKLEIIDPIVAILVAINIIYTGYNLIRESIGGLMNETDKDLLNRIVFKLKSIRKEYWIDIHHLRFWKSGENIFIDFHLSLPYYFNIKESHLEEEYIENCIQSDIPSSQVRIHLDYCANNLCKYCWYEGCKVRTENFNIKIDWDEKKILGDPLETEGHIS